MNSEKHSYQYGSDPKNVVELTEIEAHAVNNLVILEFDAETGHALINVDEVDMEAYNRAADYLNQYIADHGGSIECTDEWLEGHDILTLIK